MVKNYEGMFLIRLKLRQQDIVTGQEDPNPESVVDYIKNVLLQNEAEIIKDEIWDKRRQLAYEIDHEKEAMYYRTIVKMDSTKINKVRDILRRNNRILRFVFFVIEENDEVNNAVNENRGQG